MKLSLKQCQIELLTNALQAYKKAEKDPIQNDLKLDKIKKIKEESMNTNIEDISTNHVEIPFIDRSVKPALNNYISYEEEQQVC